MIDQNLARLRAHRNNIQRYRSLLGTKLSELERAYILRRLRDEEAAETLLQLSSLPSTSPPTQTAA